MTEPPPPSDWDREGRLLDLVKTDYEATHRALAGFVTSASQLRAVAIAAWGVIYAAALTTKSVSVAVVGTLLLLAFLVADGYYSALYRQTLRRSRKIEGVLHRYHQAIGIQHRNRRRVARAVAELEQHAVGVHREMKPVNHESRWWWWPRPLRVAAVYPLLFAVGVATAIALAGDDARPTCRNGADDRQPCLVVTTPGPTRTVTKTTSGPTRTVTVTVPARGRTTTTP